MNFKLCYVNSPWVYFTTIERLESQWGDDWDDVPYEHNSGDPYEWKEYMLELKPKVIPYKILRIGINNCFFKTPCDNYTNSPYSVEDINKRNAPWLENDDYKIYAGTSLGDFCKIVKEVGGEVYFPLFNPSGT